MNIFYTDHSPYKSATNLCDKHIVQMIRETAQLLSTAHRVLDGFPFLDGEKTRLKLQGELDTKIPQATHHFHPCAVWVRQSYMHYDWLWAHFDEMLSEYTRRYKKIHFYQQFLSPLIPLPRLIPDGCFLDPPQCTPDEFKVPGNSVEAYRRYYIGAKARFAKWNHSSIPSWWPNQNGNGFMQGESMIKPNDDV